jgi:hypothetical protein
MCRPKLRYNKTWLAAARVKAVISSNKHESIKIINLSMHKLSDETKANIMRDIKSLNRGLYES